MGYVHRDAVGPAVTTYTYASRFKNMMLHETLGWPTTTVDGIKVFARLYYYQNGVGIYKTPRHLNIYKLLGMDVKEMEAQEFQGVENAYMDIKGINIDYGITTSEISTYIEEFSPIVYPDNPDVFNPDPAPDPMTNLNPDPNAGTDDAQWDNEGWITSYITYTPPSSAHVSEFISDTDIFNLVSANDKNTLWYDSEDSSRLTALALRDSTGVMFETNMRVVNKSLEQKTTYVRNRNRSYTGSNSARYLKTAVIEYRFRRVVGVTDPSVATYLSTISADVAALDDMRLAGGITGRSIRKAYIISESLYSSYAQQLTDMYEYMVPMTETALSYNHMLKVDGMKALKVKQFVEIFAKQIVPGHTKKKTKWYKKLLVIIIDIIVVIVVVLLAISGQFWAIPLAISIGALAQGALAGYWAKRGDYTAAAYAGKHAQFLAKAAVVASIAYMLLGDPGVMEQIIAAATAAAQASGDENLQLAAAIAGLILTGYKASQGGPTSSLMLSSISMLNQSFSLYVTYIAPPTKGIAERQKELEETTKQLEDMSGPEKIDTMEREFSDPYNNYIDMNEKMQGMPYILTQGMNSNLMSRYYDPVYT